MPADKVVARLIAEIITKLDDRGLKDGEKKTKETAGRIKKNLAAAFSVAAIVDFGRRAVSAFNEQEQAVSKVRNALETMGPVAGKSLDALLQDASDLQKSSLFGDEEILDKVTAQLLTFGNVAGDAFDRGQQAALDMATFIGGDLKESAIRVGKALEDPIKGVGALSDVGTTFSDSQKALIRTMVEAGDTASAQGVILEALEKQYGGAAAAAAEAGTGGFQQIMMTLGDLSEIVGELIVTYLSPLAEVIGDLINWVDGLEPGTRALVVGIGALAVAVGGLMLAFGPVGAIIGLVAAGVLVLIKNFDKVKRVATQVFNSVRNTIVSALSRVLTVVSQVAGVFDSDWAASIDAVKEKIESYAVSQDEATDSASDLGQETAALERDTAALQAQTESATGATKAQKKAMDENAKSAKALTSAYVEIAASLATGEEGFSANKAEIAALEKHLKDLFRAGKQNTKEFERLSDRLDQLRLRVASTAVGFAGLKPVIEDTKTVIDDKTGLTKEVNLLNERLAVTPDMLRQTANAFDAELGEQSKSRNAVSNLSVAFSGLAASLTDDGPGTLIGALRTDITNAFVETFVPDTGIPGVLGQFVDGALADLAMALVGDLEAALLGEGGLVGVFQSVFGAEGPLAGLLGIGGPVMLAVAAAVALIRTYKDEVREFLGFADERSIAEITESAEGRISQGLVQGQSNEQIINSILASLTGGEIFAINRDFEGGLEGFVRFLLGLINSARGAGGAGTGVPGGEHPGTGTGPGAGFPVGVGRLIQGLIQPLGISLPHSAGRQAVPVVQVQIGDEPIEDVLVRVMRGVG